VTDIPVKPICKTLRQTAIIFNVSTRTIRRRANCGELEWLGAQITVRSIERYVEERAGKGGIDDEPEEKPKEIEREVVIIRSNWATRW